MRRGQVRALDLLLPTTLALWWVGVQATDPTDMNDYGLLAALPPVFFVAVVLLLGSIVAHVLRPELSPVRLGLHLVALVVMLHGTIPLVLSEPFYPWVYKHVGVVGYINLHGSVDSAVDIYHNWPGFFALAAWFTRIAGVADPLEFAAWAPVYFNLFACLVIGFAYRSLPVTPRARWLGLFLFVGGNWVGQDYFAPQAAAFVLSMAVLGIVLTALRADRPPAVVRVVRRLAARVARPGLERVDSDGGPPLPGPHRLPVLIGLFLVFAVVVVTHQLSPYIVVLALGLLTAAGMVRPRWVVVALIGLTAAYLAVHLPYIERTQDLFSPLGDPFRKFYSNPSDGTVVMAGRRRSGLAAPVLMACMWALGTLGMVGRLRNGRPALLLALLAYSPVLIIFGQSYGGEVIFRIYLFSLPWTALLGACALEPRSPRRPAWPVLRTGIVLSGAVGLLILAVFGSAELYAVRSGEVEASRYFYDHAQPAGLTLVAPNFPTGVGDRYDVLAAAGGIAPVPLSSVAYLQHRMLGEADLPAIAQLVGGYSGEGVGGYLVLSTGQQVFSEVMGLLPPGSLASLDAALARSPEWRLFYRNPDAVIYQVALGPEPPPVGELSPVSRREPADRSVDPAGIVAGLVGLGAVGLVLRRRARAVPVAAEPVVEVVTTAPDVADLLREAMRTPAYDRQRFREAIGAVEREDGQLAELIAAVVVGHRSEAVRLLAEAWGPIPSAELGVLLTDPSAPVRAAALSAVDPSGDDVAVLHRLLAGDPSADVRAAAVGGLARAPEREQLRALSRALADVEAEVRASAIATLPAAGTLRAAAMVVAAADDVDEAVRDAAHRRLAAAPEWILWMALVRSAHRTEMLGGLDAERLTGMVLERMWSPEVTDRVLAVELAGHLGTEVVLTQTIHALADTDAVVRRAAATRLAGFDPAVPALVAIMGDDPDAGVRLAAARALAHVGDAAVPAFLGALQDPEPGVRRLAVRALRPHPSAGLARRLIAELSGSNLDSVGEALLGMGLLGEEALLSAAVDDPPERAAAALVLLSRTDIATRLRARLGVVDPVIRMRAVEVLGTLGGPAAVDGLAAALSDSRPTIRVRAARHLGRIGGEGCRRAVQQAARSDRAPEVVEAAREALRLIDERADRA